MVRVGNPDKRMGVSKNVKEHKWFIGYEWDKLLCKEITPWYVPKVK